MQTHLTYKKRLEGDSHPACLSMLLAPEFTSWRVPLALKKKSTSLLSPLGLTSRQGQAGELNKAGTDLFAVQEFPTQLIDDA